MVQTYTGIQKGLNYILLRRFWKALQKIKYQISQVWYYIQKLKDHMCKVSNKNIIKKNFMGSQEFFLN